MIIKKKKINPLLVILSPREIPQFKEAIDTITNYDKFWIKNHTKIEAYPLMQKTFLSHKKYTHLIPIPDDLIVTKEKLDTFLNDYSDTYYYNKKGGRRSNDKIIVTGFCNVDVRGYQDRAAISFDRVSIRREDRDYKFVSLDELRNSRFMFKYVEWAGFPLMLIPRSAVEKIRFRNDSPGSGDDESGCCYDVMFCHDAQELGYIILCNTLIELDHLKHTDEAIESIHLQGKKKETYWERKERKKLNF